MNARCPSRIALLAVVCLALAPFAVLAQSTEQLVKIGKKLHAQGCPVITDPAGNAEGSPVDFTKLYIGNDADHVYFLVEFADDASQNVSSALFLNTDMNQATGCDLSIPRLNGAEYGVFFYDAATDPFLGDFRDCGSGSDDFPDRGGVRMAMQGRFVVLSVPIPVLQILATDVDGFPIDSFLVSVNGGGGDFGPAAYKFR